MITVAFKNKVAKIYSNFAFKIFEFVLVNSLMAIGIWAIFIIDPLRQKILPPCYIYSNTGLYCPGCGMTRALHSIVHGDFIQAGRYNLIAFIIIGLSVALYLIYFGWRLFNLNLLSKIDIKIKYIFGFLIVLGLYYVLRNLHFAPFIYLAP